ncbi:flagellar hook-basal body complex protein [Alicyclobacillus sp. TC]|uniref:Flagellar hook protein FlgE n=2 Tax=Alicyclobacillus tolerans TaxID=90970 RepID=A0A1M6RPM8_9BACL|nr:MULTISPECIES: flagellar hook-basal body complex protein [Alicyclobacillus]MDP9728851.1 flagellar hook protein FlgE [Alicyclobacillus tengchongensis]QRF23715.1 flagellar hook-basal body complex protein [Alicyclobacillus sp. TC]SHK34471.1 flagellar hook protein FlgE [Alicyclobacillus montanus]
MLRSLGSAVSGMDAFQTDLDVVGNNIANVNTIGYKSARAVFADMLSQTLSGATAPTYTGATSTSTNLSGGVNAQQVGLGTQIEAIQNEWTQGADQTTGNPLDVAINGAGLFAVTPDPNSSIALTNNQLSGSNSSVYYTRAGDFSLDANSNLVLPNGNVVLGYEVTSSSNSSPNTGNLVPININTLVTQAGGNPNSSSTTGSWTLASNPNVTIGSNGSITVTDTSGNTHVIGYLALATFPNYGGLQKIGDSEWSVTGNSGQATFGQPSSTSGTLQSGAVEQSNVDLTQEFAEMIVAQNGYAANSQVISTDKQILQTLMNNV